MTKWHVPLSHSIIIGSAVGSLTENIILNGEGNSVEIINETVKSATMGLITSIPAAGMRTVINVAKAECSAARQLMVYDEKFGENIELFFNQVINALMALEE